MTPPPEPLPSGGADWPYGGAEMVHALDFAGGQCRVAKPGSLQDREIRDEICRVMEGGREAFERRFRSKRRMSTDFLARMLQQRSQTRLIRFDEQPVAGANVESLSRDVCDSFRTGRSDADADTFLQKLGIVVPDEEGRLRPTVAGVLVACAEPRRWLPNAYTPGSP